MTANPDCLPFSYDGSGILGRTTAILMAVFCLTFGGCGYMVGGLYRNDVQTVHVPIVKSSAFRRDVELQLTEAIHKEILKQTHFRLVKDGNADTKLSGRIISVGKGVLGEAGDDSPRELQLQIGLEVTWEDLRHNSRPIVDRKLIDLPPETARLLTHSDFSPETGASMATARQRAVENLARQVVQMMQTPW